ncbi:MAG TPA: hypothetical protein PKA37_04485 [Planctomycetota bacterium]|nr:hypothetical protein [Planctomycetota bacterium]
MPANLYFSSTSACIQIGFLSLWRTPGVRLLLLTLAFGGPLLGLLASPIAEQGLFFWSLASAAAYFFLVAILVLYILARPVRAPVPGAPVDPVLAWFARACGAWVALLTLLAALVAAQVLFASLDDQLVGFDPRTAVEISLMPSYAALMGSMTCLATSLLPWALTLSVAFSPTVASLGFLMLVLGGSLLRGISPDLGFVRFLFGVFPEVSLLLPDRPFAEFPLTLWGYSLLHGLMILVLGALLQERKRERGDLGVSVFDEDGR